VPQRKAIASSGSNKQHVTETDISLILDANKVRINIDHL
jgi:hypothetical protein